MKEFNYEKARQGAKLCTRAGQPARIICWDRKAYGRPILALVENAEGFEQVMKYNERGKFFYTNEAESLDLMIDER